MQSDSNCLTKTVLCGVSCLTSLVTLFKPIWCYGIEMCGCDRKFNIAITQRSQSKILRAVTVTPCYETNHIPHTDFNIPSSSFCEAGGIPPSALQPFEACCINPALVPPFISRGALRHRRERPQLVKWPVKFSLTVRLPRRCRVL
jgi:hypothetical protein